MTAVFYASRLAARHMRENRHGRIVNVASIAGKEGNPMAAAYSASKAAVIGMTKSVGKDVAGTGVLVNCLCPAPIDTPMVRGLSEEHVQYMLSRVPMGRLASTDEAARAMVVAGDVRFAMDESIESLSDMIDAAQQADLVVIKGDANYRRILEDRKWDCSLRMEDLADYFPAPFAVLRTMKSEIVVDIPRKEARRLAARDPEWLINGRRANYWPTNCVARKWGYLHVEYRRRYPC